MMDAWTDRLSEYIDGDLPGEDRRALEAHLAQCDACRATVLELRAVTQQAAALPRLEPARDLWKDIASAIESAGDATIVEFPRKVSGRRFSFSVPQLAAAGIAVMAISAGSMWFAIQGGGQADPTGALPTLSAVDATPDAGTQLVSNVEGNYDTAIQELERALETTRAELDPRTVAVIEENLRIIDAAIADAAEALAADPGDVDLYQYLDHTLMKKIDLLRRATTLGRAQT